MTNSHLFKGHSNFKYSYDMHPNFEGKNKVAYMKKHGNSALQVRKST